MPETSTSELWPAVKGSFSTTRPNQSSQHRAEVVCSGPANSAASNALRCGRSVSREEGNSDASVRTRMQQYGAPSCFGSRPIRSL
jgi:hypothetical protein